MATEADPRNVSRSAFAGRLSRGRVVLIVATLVFAALVAAGTLTPLQGLIALAIIGIAALINRTNVDEAVAARANLDEK